MGTPLLRVAVVQVRTASTTDPMSGYRGTKLLRQRGEGTTMAQASDATPGGPLTGIRIVEIAGLGAGPFCAMMLADMGADVIRVDRPAASHDGGILGRNRRSVV